MPDRKITLYRPSNGTEGEIFISQWCCHCARDKSLSDGKDYEECSDDEICKIIANSMAYDTGDDEYPIEWVLNDKNEPTCTAFIKAGEPIPFKDELTIDMFGG